MKRYLVGGAVRDKLLGLPSGDRDWVVVGADAEELRAAGYIAVGRDFPVFLDPATREEHALARTERKTAPGYRGFEFHADRSVTLEDDLLRRDLTINAIAEDENGNVIDPHGGRADLAAKVLRHVSPAFAEDPVRILRVARFAARFAELGFSVAPETLGKMREMVAAGEVNALVPDAGRSVGVVNAVTGRGRHTSTNALMLPLPAAGAPGGPPDGWIVDTPGIRSFGLAHVDPDHLIEAFPDLHDLTADCPRGCTHGFGEPECGLDEAVGDQRDRVESFRRLLASREEPAY